MELITGGNEQAIFGEEVQKISNLSYQEYMTYKVTVYDASYFALPIPKF